MAEVQEQQLRRVAQVEAMIMMNTTVEEANSRASNHGKYRAIEIIGKGTFGTVFRAIDNHENRIVAIKICKTDVGLIQMFMHGLRSSHLLQQALEEAEHLNKLRHPYVLEMLEVYDFTSERGGKGVALVTEYCANGNLQQYLEQNHPDEEKRFKWCNQLAEAMQHIHFRNITHRDIKPANILISGDDVKIGDVGVAKATWDCSTAVQGVEDVPFQTYMCTKAGTPAYMAPEIREGHYTNGSDIFSLGLVFVMIVESPAKLVPYAHYAGERKVLGQLMYDNVESRGRRPVDLLELEIKSATKSEVRLFDRMLEYSYHKRPTAEEVVDEIKDMNRARGFQLITTAVAERDAREPKKLCC